MKKVPFGKSGIEVPAIALGCMRITGLSETDAAALLRTAIEQGVNFFDHADIYARGEAESLFAKVLPSVGVAREDILLQSKCGIRPGVCYDFSSEHILRSVDGILSRLQTEYLDVLLLHRPDALMEPEEVAEAFSALEAAGKVRHFGVSNQNPSQMALLAKAVKQPLVANQMQMSIPTCPMVDAGIHVNTLSPSAVDRDGGTLDYCRLHDITLQAWSPFQYGFFEGVFLSNPLFPELNAVIARLAERYSVTPEAIAIAWLLRHPAKMQAVVGTTNRQRLQDICAATTFTLARDEWYELYLAAGKKLP